jgi:hypothetical protein
MDEGFDEAEHSEESAEDMVEYYVGELATEDEEELIEDGEEVDPPPEWKGRERAIFLSIPGLEELAPDAEGDEDESNDDEEEDEGGIVYDPEDLVTEGVFSNGQKEKFDLVLSERVDMNKNTRLFRFALPQTDDQLGECTVKFMYAGRSIS